ncbi:DapH/DapD/GlmU-related protein [Ruminococcus sp.]|uniref:acyltransferase n=1 Tax=Ruminococcus sp. TaxID=41978 RepID=UPI0025E6D0E8|nr:acyltransferase [Ruminococcus sp.]
MYEIRYYFSKFKSKILKNNKEVISDFFRKYGMTVGKGCNICCNIMTTEPFLVEIGNNVTISGDVILITHDNSISKVDNKCPNIYGKIKIGNNCFIGQRSTLLYGVTLVDNVIVAAGSVVTKSVFKSGIIIGGNPAHEISTWSKFIKENGEHTLYRNDLRSAYENNSKHILEER